jgi:hypothetical protein
MERDTTLSFDKFLGDLRSDGTRINYGYGIQWVTKDAGGPDKFLQLAKEEPEVAVEKLKEFIKSRRDKLAPASVNNPVMAVRSFLESYDVKLNWKQVRKVLPQNQKIALDRPPSIEEIRRLLEVCGLREKVAILIMESSGIRVGAFDYLKIRDFTRLKSGIGRLLVYENTGDKYYTFVTPEASAALVKYLEEREKIGEKVGPDSPLLRNDWDWQGKRGIVKRVAASDAVRPWRSKQMRNWIGRLWIEAGVRENHIHRGEFQQVHGFRKFAKTQMGKAGLPQEVTEALLGHRSNYFKPSAEDLEEMYLNAVPFLTIDERFKLKVELENKEKEHGAQWKDMRLEVLSLKDENRTLENKLSNLGPLLDRLESVEKELARLQKTASRS